MKATRKNGRRSCWAAWLALALAASGCAGHRQNAASSAAAPPPEIAPGQLQAGMAEIDITPPVGSRLAGYFDERLATGTHDPLKAKALVLRQGREQAAFVFCDLLGVSLNISTNARARASRLTGIPVSHIVIAATHSHTGPLFDDPRRDYFHQAAISKFGNDPQEAIYYPTFLADRLVKVIVQAEKNLQPAELGAGVATQAGLPFNRRYHMKNGTVVFNPGLLNPNVIGPAGPVDSNVGMLIVTNRNLQRAIGGLTVFAMHADTLGGTEFSADYPYFIEQTLRDHFSQSYISAFGAGTCGDLNHVNVNRTNRPVNGPEISERIGAAIGETVVHNLRNLTPIEQPALAVRSVTLQLPLQTVTAEELAAARTNITRMADPKLDFFAKVRAVKALELAAWGPTLPMEVQVFRLDDNTAIVCLPAEIFVELGLAIKQASPFKTTLVISICNDRPGYMPTIKAFKEGSYEVVNSRLQAGSGEKMVEAAVKMLNELKE